MEFSFETWWTAMDKAEKIYWLFAVPFTVVFIFQLILTFMGGDADDGSGGGDVADHDASFDHDHGIGIQFLSVKNLIGFFTIFGWTGIAMIKGGKSISATIIVSILAGTLMMFIMAMLIYYLYKMAEDSSLNLKNAIGKIGTVYLRIPRARTGMGKVQINVQGFQTLDAMTDEQEDINTGMVIEVTEVVNNEILLVKQNK